MPPTRRWIKAALNASLATPALPWTRGQRRRPQALSSQATVATAPTKSGSRAAR